MSKQAYSICCCFKRRFHMKEAEAPPEIKDLFQTYSDNGSMDVDHFHGFLKEVQGEKDLTREKAGAIMDDFLADHKHLNILPSNSLDINHFLRYLLSDSNSPLPSSNEAHQDMTAPLSHYFMYTGHNSYLTGNQINSVCSDKPIVEALQRGVRVIELDMWPNSKKDDVDIMHGGTLTPPLKLITCLRAIKEHAFVASKYPVIVTLEDHLTPDLQAKVAKMVTEVFGDILLKDASECLEMFPSPDSLKGRVILSTKPPKEHPQKKGRNVSLKEDEASLKSQKLIEEKSWGKEIPDLDMDLIQEDEELQDEDEPQDKSEGLQPNASPKYKHVIGIRAQKMKGGIKTWLQVCSQNVHRVSLNEEKLKTAVKTHGTDIVSFTQRNLMRVYPKGMRIDSSNYNPLVGWMHGAQMVAFNMQGHGRCLWLMQGFFRANGGCGYVKKPDFLMRLSPHGILDPKCKQVPAKTTLKVKVYMGEGWNRDFKRTHFDLCSPPDFYVKMGIAGVSCDSRQGMEKTGIIEDNWFPEWNAEFKFPLSVPELALLRIEVHESDMHGKDDFGGQTCVPVWELRSGIRAVPLHDHRGDKYTSVRLLMRFDFV